jgi:hypothetical protein
MSTTQEVNMAWIVPASMIGKKGSYAPDILSAACHSAFLYDPAGYKTFTMDIDNGNRQHDRIQRIRRTRKEVIKLWQRTSKLLRE